MTFLEIANAQVDRYPENKIEQVFEITRTELAGHNPDPVRIRATAAANIVSGYNEFQELRRVVNDLQSVAAVQAISQIPKNDITNVLSPALNAAAGDAVANAIRLHGPTDTFGRALINIRGAYDLLKALLS